VTSLGQNTTSFQAMQPLTSFEDSLAMKLSQERRTIFGNVFQKDESSDSSSKHKDDGNSFRKWHDILSYSDRETRADPVGQADPTDDTTGPLMALEEDPESTMFSSIVDDTARVQSYIEDHDTGKDIGYNDQQGSYSHRPLSSTPARTGVMQPLPQIRRGEPSPEFRQVFASRIQEYTGSSLTQYPIDSASVSHDIQKSSIKSSRSDSQKSDRLSSESSSLTQYEIQTRLSDNIKFSTRRDKTSSSLIQYGIQPEQSDNMELSTQRDKTKLSGSDLTQYKISDDDGQSPVLKKSELTQYEFLTDNTHRSSPDLTQYELDNEKRLNALGDNTLTDDIEMPVRREAPQFTVSDSDRTPAHVR
jgi:hypothetical protein